MTLSPTRQDAPAEVEQTGPAASGSVATAASTAATAASTIRGLRGNWLLALLAAAVGLFLSILDQTVTGVANQAISKDFGLNNVDVQWITTGYRLSQGVVVPLGVWAYERFGMRRTYLVSLVLYAVTSFLCGISWNLDSLVFFRILQAVPGALAAIVCFGIIFRVMPPRHQVVGMSILAMSILSAPGFSPAIGGFFVDFRSWRLVFFIAVPVALFGLVFAAWVLPPLPDGGPRPFDWGGFLCMGTALVCLVLALSKVQDWGWTSYATLILLAVGIDALILFVIIERQRENPLLQLHMFASQPYTIGMGLVLIVMTNVATIPAFLPQYLQQVQNEPAANSGLVLVPQALTWLLAVPIAANLMSRIGVRWTMVLGLVLLGGGCLYLNRLFDVDLPRPMLVTILCVRSFGLGMAIVAVLGSTIVVLPGPLRADGIVVRTVFQRIGSELGILYFTQHVAHRRQQVLNDRTQLLGPSEAPLLHAQQRTDPTSLLSLFQSQQGHDLAQAYGEVFQIIGVITLVGVVLALVARWGEELPTTRDTVERGT